MFVGRADFVEIQAPQRLQTVHQVDRMRISHIDRRHARIFPVHRNRLDKFAVEFHFAHVDADLTL